MAACLWSTCLWRGEKVYQGELPLLQLPMQIAQICSGYYSVCNVRHGSTLGALIGSKVSCPKWLKQATLQPRGKERAMAAWVNALGKSTSLLFPKKAITKPSSWPVIGSSGFGDYTDSWPVSQRKLGKSLLFHPQVRNNFLVTKHSLVAWCWPLKDTSFAFEKYLSYFTWYLNDFEANH